MVGFNEHGRLVKMSSVRAILDMFYNLRLNFYQKRKDYLLSRLMRELTELEERERFILEVIEEKIIIKNVRRVKICQILKDRKYRKYSELPKIKTTKVDIKPVK